MQVDTTVADTSIAAASVSSDNLEGGAKAADEMAKLIGGQGFGRGDERAAGRLHHRAADPGLPQGDQEVPQHQAAPHPVRRRQPDQGGPGDHRAVLGPLRTWPACSPPTCSSPRAWTPGSRAPARPARSKIIGYDADPTQVSDLKSGVVAGADRAGALPGGRRRRCSRPSTRSPASRRSRSSPGWRSSPRPTSPR